MNIAKNTVVSLAYELRADNAQGDVVEKVSALEPAEFLFGAGGLLPLFEKNLDGKAAGEPFEFVISSEEGYGPIDEEAIVDIPKDVFMVDGKIAEDLLFEGNVISMRDGEGNSMMGRVVEIADEAVVMDFNHPMAGKNLHFSGNVIAVRAATPEEVTHGHVHGAGGHHH